MGECYVKNVLKKKCHVMYDTLSNLKVSDLWLKMACYQLH